MLRGVPARSQGNAPWGPRISGPFSRRRRERIYKGTVLVIEESTETVASVGTALPTVELVHITPNGEDTIERACRTCYLSFHRYDPPRSTEELIKKILRHGHFSVLEHAIATFRVKGGSRVFTHEMVRHRLVSPSQESQRYVCYADRPGDPDAKSFKDRPRKKTRDFEVVVPPTVEAATFAPPVFPRKMRGTFCPTRRRRRSYSPPTFASGDTSARCGAHPRHTGKSAE